MMRYDGTYEEQGETKMNLGVLVNLVLRTAFLVAFAVPFHVLDLKIPTQ